VRSRILDDARWAQVASDRFATRLFNVDLDPRLILCRGRTVDMIVRSGTSEYFSFKSLDDALMLDTDNSLIRVPCSKSAVFKSKDIGMLEKRQLMRFLQHCMDAATTGQGGEDALRFRNETGLNQGRSLARPQNKAAKGYELGASTTSQPSLEESQSFEAFLRGPCRLSQRLINSVMYAVALLPAAADKEPLTMAEGMSRVQKFLGGLGRFGKTAFL